MARKQFVKRHNDGSLWAKGTLEDGVMEGYWEFFRLNGTRMGSGYFTRGKKSGTWTTYDRKGKVYKVTYFASKSKEVDAYIARFPAKTQVILKRLRRTIHAAAPGAVETISYRMPSFDLDGRHLAYVAGYEHHVGFYPVPTSISAFKEELAPYKQGRGSVQFPLDKPVPYALVAKIVKYRAKQQAKRR